MEHNKQNYPQLVNSIIEGIQEKKGLRIAVLDMRKIHDTICDFMIITEGNTPTQVDAIENSIWDMAQKSLKEKPVNTHRGNGEWIAMDYIDVVVHIMVPERREFYKLEQLWADADIEHIADLN